MILKQNTLRNNSLRIVKELSITGYFKRRIINVNSIDKINSKEVIFFKSVVLIKKHQRILLND